MLTFQRGRIKIRSKCLKRRKQRVVHNFDLVLDKVRVKRISVLQSFLENLNLVLQQSSYVLIYL